jgi:hypothetical protein
MFVTKKSSTCRDLVRFTRASASGTAFGYRGSRNFPAEHGIRCDDLGLESPIVVFFSQTRNPVSERPAHTKAGTPTRHPLGQDVTTPELITESTRSPDSSARHSGKQSARGVREAWMRMMGLSEQEISTRQEIASGFLLRPRNSGINESVFVIR